MKIYELTPADIALLANMLKRAGQDEKRVRIAWHNPAQSTHGTDCPRYGWADEPALARHCTCSAASGLMVKVGEGMWTAPLGRPEQD